MRLQFLKCLGFVLCLDFCRSEDYFIGHARTKLEKIKSGNDVSNFEENSQKCLKDLFKYIEDFDKRKSWAVYMMDSGASYLKPGELLPGFWGNSRLADLGNNYPICLNLKHEDISGSYCLINYNVENFLNSLTPEEKESEHVVETIKFFNVTSTDKIHRYFQCSRPVRLRLAACLPDSCSPEILNKLNLLPENAEVAHCHTKKQMDDYRALNALDWTFIIFMALILILVLISTLRYLKFDKSKKGDVIGAFNLVANYEELMNFSGNGKNYIGCLEGFRCGCIIVEVIFHLFYTINYIPAYNFKEFFESFYVPSKIWLNQIHVVVDTFYLMGGLVMTFMFLNTHFGTSGAFFSPVKHYLRRYLRLTPVIAVVIWYQVTLLRVTNLTGDHFGPLWHDDLQGGGILATICNDCKNYFWTALLHIQNLINPHNFCIDQLWYVQTDMQLTFISPAILLFLASKKFQEKTKYKVLFGLTFALFGYSVGYYFYYGWNGIFLKSVVQDNYIHFYVNTLTKGSPWMVGVIFGYILFNAPKNHNLNKWLSSPSNRLKLWIFCGLTAFLCVEGAILLPDIENIYPTGFWNRFIHAFYGIVYRPVWAAMIGIIVYTLHIIVPNGNGNKFMKNSVFQYISKISFSMYVCHMTICHLKNAQSVGGHLNNFSLVFEAVGLIVLHVAVGTFLTLFIEMPFVKLQKIIITPDRVPQEKLKNGFTGPKMDLKNGKTN